jgi:hypothetical protein
MRSITKTTVLAGLLFAAPAVMHAQFDFKVDGLPVQVHSFLSQGFAYSNDNNYLTMKTSQGSFAMTDFGANVSVRITDKFRVGAQVYDRNIGQLGKWHPDLDWAYGDYKFKDWFGVRAGKVKTALGLYNDTQDTESLHTWALLPQSLYPLDLRSNTIAHTGGDIYGTIPLHAVGSLSYTGYIGARSFDPQGGYYYFSSDLGMPISSISGRAAGGDWRWNTPVQGLMLGASFMDQTQDRKGMYTSAFLAGFSYDFVANPQRTTAAYADYSIGKWHFDGEFRRNHYIGDIATGAFPGIFAWNGSDKGWFASVSYRVNRWLELGTYNSRYYVDQPANPADTASNHIFDQTATVRFDLTKFWDFKVEEHFINGYGDLYSAHGFYQGSNPNGLKPKTDLLVVRTGLSF